MKIVLLGAGASFATLGGQIAPISEGFGRTLNDQVPEWKNRYPFLRSAVTYLQRQQNDKVQENTWPLDAVWNSMGVFAQRDEKVYSRL